MRPVPALAHLLRHVVVASVTSLDRTPAFFNDPCPASLASHLALLAIDSISCPMSSIFTVDFNIDVLRWLHLVKPRWAEVILSWNLDRSR